MLFFRTSRVGMKEVRIHGHTTRIADTIGLGGVTASFYARDMLEKFTCDDAVVGGSGLVPAPYDPLTWYRCCAEGVWL